MNTEKNANKMQVAIKVICITLIITFVGYAALTFSLVALPVYKLRNIYNKQADLIKTISDKTEPVELLVKAEELSTLTDEQVYELINKTGSVSLFDENTKSFEEYANNWLTEYDTDIKYPQLVSISDFIKGKCQNVGLTSVNLEYCVTLYITNMMSLGFFNKASDSIQGLYESLYQVYNALGTKVENDNTPLAMTSLVETMTADEELRTKLLGNSTALKRVFQVYYADVRSSYQQIYGTSTDIIQAQFFDSTSVDQRDMINLRILACNEFKVTGKSMPGNITEEDLIQINNSRTKARELLSKLNLRFNMLSLTEDEEKELSSFVKFTQHIASPYVSQVYEELVRYSSNELASVLQVPNEMTTEQLNYYNREYIFWNMMQNDMDFLKASDLGYPVARLNMLDATIEYAYIDGGTLIMNTELESLFWVSAEQTLMSQIYDNCLLEIQEDGTVVPEDTNDSRVAGYRNLFEAWNLWGSQFSGY